MGLVQISQEDPESNITIHSGVDDQVRVRIQPSETYEAFFITWSTSGARESFTTALEAVTEGVSRVVAYDNAVRAQRENRTSAYQQMREAVQYVVEHEDGVEVD